MTSYRSPVLLLIHGAGASAAVWPEQLLRLPNVITLAIDLPGHGRSPLPGRRAISHYADSVSRFILADQFSDVVLVGHSMGGAIALELARCRPAYLSGLVLLSTAARLRVGPALFATLSGDFPQATAMISSLSYAADAPQAWRDATAAEMLRCGRTTTTGDFLACNAFDLTAELSDLSLPSLVISGSADRMVVHRHSAALAAALPAATFHALDGVGHTVMQEAPEQVAHLVFNFLHEVRVD